MTLEQVIGKTVADRIGYHWSFAAGEVRQLVGTGIFSAPGHPLFQSAFTRLMILANEMAQGMSKTETPGRLSTPVVAGQTVEVSDITDLINLFRVSLCHIKSERHRWPRLDDVQIYGGWMVRHGGDGHMVFAGVPEAPVPHGDYVIGVGPFRILMEADLMPALNQLVPWAELDQPPD